MFALIRDRTTHVPVTNLGSRRPINHQPRVLHSAQLVARGRRKRGNNDYDNNNNNKSLYF